MSSIQAFFLVLYLAFMLYVFSKTQVKRIVQDKKWQHIFFGSIVAVSLLWMFRVSIYEGLVMHFLWLTTLTLVLGFRWAMLAGFAILIMSSAIGDESWLVFGINGILGIVLPICLSYGVFALSFHKMKRHLFVYIFVCAFFAGALSIAIKMLALSAYFYLSGEYTWDVIQYNYTQMILLLVLQEAFFNGFTITCLVVYKPDLVHTYHDKFYLTDDDRK